MVPGSICAYHVYSYVLLQLTATMCSWNLESLGFKLEQQNSKTYGKCTVAEAGPTLCNKANSTATSTSTTNETQILEQTYNTKISIILPKSSGVTVCLCARQSCEVTCPCLLTTPLGSEASHTPSLATLLAATCILLDSERPQHMAWR